MAAEVLDVTLEDISIRSQVRATGPTGSSGVFVRSQLAGLDRQNYFAGVGYSVASQRTLLFIGRNDPGPSQFIDTFPLPVSVDVRVEDVTLQLDAFGNKLELYGWRTGDSMPDAPQLEMTDDTYSNGIIGVFSNAGNDDSGVGTFRYVHVADTPIPEPTSFALAGLACAGLLSCRRRGFSAKPVTLCAGCTGVAVAFFLGWINGKSCSDQST